MAKCFTKLWITNDRIAICMHLHVTQQGHFNTLGPRQDGRYFADDVLKCIFLNGNVWNSLTIPLKFVPKGQINNIPPLVVWSATSHYLNQCWYLYRRIYASLNEFLNISVQLLLSVLGIIITRCSDVTWIDYSRRDFICILISILNDEVIIIHS